ncbi:MAG TPA: YggT family protein [Herpetosiphon sp.]|uniref:YggT family protein n=2 Tax=Herpetosiphon TaxID=64 RepID=A9B8C5_HERA2|nr:YggT family protein [Herpetosiphon sp.]ABX06478.1 protein of unknown function YGGT [Herpetosiphon aurantiacus DSM 785]MCA0353234.1 YggT family protein [Chloroflexota bacterium]HBW50146.1 YggT family protein [Herpetosiphon sp.]
MGNFISQFFLLLIPILEIAIFVRIIMSWFDPTGQSRFALILREITDPILLPIRRVIPSIGMFDLSPLIALLILQVLQTVFQSVS